jgi:acyl CoA:acetate/3-ketoacid CoA transferase beta subunit
MKPLTAEQVRARAARAANGGARIVEARVVAATGELSADDPACERARDATRVVVTMSRLGEPDGGRIVERCPSPSGVLAALIVTDLAVLEPTADGLAVREVVAGVSALDVQKRVEAPLLAGPDLRPLEP